jgi:hypothetical protein
MVMNHEFYGPTWADNHARLGDAVALALAGAAKALSRPFERLLAYQYAAPWHQPRRQVRLPHAD